MTRPNDVRFVLLLTLVGAAGCRSHDPAPLVARPPAGTVVLSEAQMTRAGIVIDTTRLETVSLPLSVAGTVVTPDPLTASVGSIVEGRIERVLVLPGDRVAAGDPLVHIHSHELATAQRDLAAAAAEHAVAEAAYRRSARLLAAEAVSQEEVERRAATLEQARAELERSREVVDHLHPSPDGDVVVRAPRSGVVFAVKIRSGEAVVVGAPLVDLGDASRLWVTGFIPENAVVNVGPAATVVVSFDALPGVRVEGRVVRMGGVVDSIRRAVEVRIELERVPPGVRPGMFASLLVPAADPAERVVLPADAVQRTQEGDAVFVVDGPGTFRLHRVRAAALPDGRMAVELLPAGLPVVVKGAYALKSELEVPVDDAGA